MTNMFCCSYCKNKDDEEQQDNISPLMRHDIPRSSFNKYSGTITYHNSMQTVMSSKTSRITEFSTAYSKNSLGKTNFEDQRRKFVRTPIRLSSPNSPLTTKFPKEDSYHFKASDAKPITNTSKGAIPKHPIGTSNSYVSPYTPNWATTNTVTNLSFPATPRPSSSLNNITKTAQTSAVTSSRKPSITSSLTSSQSGTSFSFPTTSTRRRSFTSATKSKPAKPGYAYILNHFIFDDPKNEERAGSAEDVKSLVKTFELYGLKTTVIDNAKVEKVQKTVGKIQSKDFSDYACIVIVILSHGTRHEEIAAKDGHYSIDDHILFPILRNTSLNDKPKLFFIQACKGSMESNGFYTDAVPFSPLGSANEILKCYSTFEGFVSYRTEKGSIFIQALCQNLKLFGSTKNIKDIMELVTQIVKQQSQNKQIPAYTSTLTKPFVFGDYVKFSK